MKLNEGMLKDIGIDRSKIDSVLEDHARELGIRMRSPRSLND